MKKIAVLILLLLSWMFALSGTNLYVDNDAQIHGDLVVDGTSTFTGAQTFTGAGTFSGTVTTPKLTVSTNVLATLANGNVGIRTANPYTSLEVAGTGISTNAITVNGAVRIVGDSVEVGNLILSSNSGENLAIESGSASNADIAFRTADRSVNRAVLYVSNGENALRFQVALADAMLISSNGNVAIGNTNPKMKLDITGAIQATSINITAQPYIFAAFGGAVTGSMYTGSGNIFCTVNLNTNIADFGNGAGGSSVTFNFSTGVGVINEAGFYLFEAGAGIVYPAAIGQITMNIYITGNSVVGGYRQVFQNRTIEVAASAYQIMNASGFCYCYAGDTFALRVSASNSMYGGGATNQVVGYIGCLNPKGDLSPSPTWLRVSKLF